MRIRILRPNMAASKFKHNLARLRKQLGLSQVEVANLVGCSKTTIQSVELCRLELSSRLATNLQGALGVPADWFLANNLKSPIPEPRRVLQNGQLPVLIKYGLVEQLANAFELMDKVSDEQGLAILQISTAEYINALRTRFGRNYPDLLGPEAIARVVESVENLNRQYPKQSSTPTPPKARSRTRQSV